MTDGSCLCGHVRWRTQGDFARMSHCHCSMCRKAHGAPFVTFAAVDRERFRYVEGEEAHTIYESSAGFERPFCRHCGSAGPHPTKDGKVAVPAGCFDDDPGIQADAHIFASSRAPWHSISDTLARHDGYRPGVDAPAIERPTLTSATPDIARGSCLCGAAAFEIDLPFKVVHNCHCSRCRKARAAAHTTNGFVAYDALRFLRGEDQLVTYKPPSARFFTHAFCRTCGSGLPRADRERGIVAVPLGALDDDPGTGAVDHIFVGSKAPWYPITDALPRFEEGPG